VLTRLSAPPSPFARFPILFFPGAGTQAKAKTA
jgi:hypothetical protein